MMKRRERPDQARIDKLPAWARDYIAGLERDLESRNRLVEDLSMGPEDANVRVPEMFTVSPERAVGKDVPVDFYLGKPPWKKYVNMLDVRIRDGELQIMGHGAGAGVLVVRASSSNCMYVSVRDH